jgi:hypothetical protein
VLTTQTVDVDYVRLGFTKAVRLRTVLTGVYVRMEVKEEVKEWVKGEEVK